MTIFDPDAFDIEVMADRLPASEFTALEIAAMLGVTRVTITKAATQGRIPRPARRGETHTEPDHWSAFQVAQILAGGAIGGARSADPGPCGTHRAYKFHQRRKEPVDILCRMAERRYDREKRAKKRSAAT